MLTRRCKVFFLIFLSCLNSFLSQDRLGPVIMESPRHIQVSQCQHGVFIYFKTTSEKPKNIMHGIVKMYVMR